MKKLSKTNEFNGYKIEDADWGWYIVISSEKANQSRCYEYDGSCDTPDGDPNTREGVENFLKRHTFEEVVKAFREHYVYLECIEQIA